MNYSIIFTENSFSSETSSQYTILAEVLIGLSKWAVYSVMLYLIMNISPVQRNLQQLY